MAKLSSFWCRLLLFLALLCVSPKVLARDITFNDYTTLVKSPTFDNLMSYFQAWKSAKFVFHWVNVGQTRTQNIRKVL